VLIPSVVAVVLWLVASGYLVFTGFYDREVASSVRQVSIPAVTGLSSIQRERRLSIAYLAEPSTGLRGLIDQRQETDRRLSTLRTVAQSALQLAPSSIKTRWKALTEYLDQLAGIRSTVDSGAADRKHVYDFYNGLLDTATNLFDTQARVVPDVTATQGGIAATDTFRVSDLMSRAGSIITGAFGSRRLSPDDYLEFVNLVGAYHAQLANVAPYFRPNAQTQYAALVAGAPWKNLVAAENALISSGQWTTGAPRGLTVTAATWDAVTTAVSDALISLTIAQADEVSAQALDTGNNQLLTALIGSLIALAVAVAAIIWAIRQSHVLVDRALSVRLAKLGSEAATVVDQRLPDMLDRLRRREKVDPAVELSNQDYGSDEIGQVAAVLNRSLQVAVGAAVNEASTRAAGVAMLMGVARRPQAPLQHGLQVIEDLQSRIGDEQLLAELFDVNHQLAQTRRFLENLIILAGGQTGRRFHKPVAMRRILLAAIAETRHYQRITIRRTADVALLGGAVAGSTHLLAELLDNALAFSPPESEVWVSCSQATRGVVVEIEDAGVGMRPDDLERANELLATAPTPDVTVLRDGSQVGLWVVAELAKRGGIQVTLRTSAYGGLLAIVLLPNRLIAAEPEVLSTEPAYAAAALPGAGAGLHAISSGPVAVATLPSRPKATDNGHGYPLRPTAPFYTADAMHGNGSGRPLDDPDTAEETRYDRPDDPMSDEQQRTDTTDLPPSTSPLPWVGSTAVPEPQSASRPPLPERQPQQHLAPELHDAANAAVRESAQPARSPEEARARYARYQQGRSAGRIDETAGNTNHE
jgi:signal transduction histidine kinase